ncbi:ABC transporter permease [Clostridium sp. D53t1_180928_C8]|uniref:ABC transporter permease n=1 Tax=Clostridium sp. D53t1_180928_C8 TaxID=2787101 RepID=UPI0018AB1A8B|nr:ABC transporter permease [Clostridium sp. D53t1_180928_C8]
MKLWYYMKMNFKNMFATGVITIAYYILFPILLAGVMGFMQGTLHDSQLKIKSVNTKIVDYDNSEMSKQLVSFLEGNELSEIVNIVDKKPEVEIIINKGYGDDVLSLNGGEIIINRESEKKLATITTLKSVLDRYHQGIYVSLSDGNTLQLNNTTNSIIKNISIDSKEGATEYEKMSASMIGFIITMLIYSLIKAGYMPVSMNIDKRLNSTPITKVELLIIDSICLVAYIFIILFAYVMFFRILGISFTGEFLSLIILILLGAMLVVGIVKCISTLFGAKYGNLIGVILFTLPLISGEIFLGEGNKLAVATPTHYLNNAFSLYNLNGNLEGCGNWLIIIIAIVGITFMLAFLKEWILGRKRIWG